MSTPLTKKFVRSALEFDTDAELAAFFGVSASAVSQWHELDEIPLLRRLQAERKRPDLFGFPLNAANDGPEEESDRQADSRSDVVRAQSAVVDRVDPGCVGFHAADGRSLGGPDA